MVCWATKYKQQLPKFKILVCVILSVAMSLVLHNVFTTMEYAFYFLIKLKTPENQQKTIGGESCFTLS